MAKTSTKPAAKKSAAKVKRRPGLNDYAALLQKIHFWEILAFVASFLLIGFGFYKGEMHPWGDKQFLVTDLWHQYYPFFQILADKLQHGGSLLYSWRTGMGTNFLALMSYYCASPLNFLSFFIPREELRTGMMVILMMKFACACVFRATGPRYVSVKNDISITMFGMMYALCSYMVGYYWNTIWIDTVALLPLVMLGLTALVREGKYRTYVISLALALMSSYYIGYMVCIYVFFSFFLLCLFEGTKGKVFFKRFGLVAGTSVLGGGLSAWILLPAYYGLQMTHSVGNSFPKDIKWYEAWRDIIANMLPYTEVTSKDGLPNLYCGILPVLLLGVFVIAKKIRIREKIAGILVLAFLIFSCNLNYLNFIWHGMHFPNMLPYRFSFLFSFTLLIIGYRAIQILLDEKLSLIQWGAMIVVGGVFIWLGYTSGIQSDDHKFAISSAILGGVYLVIIFCRLFSPKQLVQFLLCAVTVYEMGAQSVNGVKAVGSSTYSIYPANKAEITSLLKIRDQHEDELFSRSEITMWYTLNDPAMYYYDGLSQFSSMANESISTFMRKIGLPGSEAGNRYFYANTSPLTNMLCDIKFIMAKDGYNADSVNATKIGEIGSTAIYQENLNLGLGFLTNLSTEFYIMDDTLSAFEQQNAMFRKMTGLNEDLFTPVDITHVGHQGYEVIRKDYGSYSYTRLDDAPQDNSFLKYNYTSPEHCVLYAYCKVTDADNLDVWYNDSKIHTYNIGRQPYITPIGEYQEGEMVTLKVMMKEDQKSGSITVYVYELNQEVLEKGYEILKAGQMQITEFKDTSFKATVNADTDKALYMSVPYEKGWTCYVDGEKARLYPMFDAMCAVNVSAGEHTIEMKYSPKGFVPGVFISIVSVAALVLLYILERKRRGKAAFDEEPEKKPEDGGTGTEAPADESDSDTEDDANDESSDDADAVPDEIPEEAEEIPEDHTFVMPVMEEAEPETLSIVINDDNSMEIVSSKEED